MAGNSLNLVEMAKGYLTGDFKNRLSSLLGESKEKTNQGINAAIPGLLSGLDNSASTPDGTRRLASAVDGADDGILSNVGSMFERSSITDGASGLLQSILGAGGLSELTGTIARYSGISGKGISTLIGFLGPVIFGMLKKLKVSRGLDATGLSSLLAGQRSNIAAAMPEGMREYREEVYTTPRAVPQARTTETYSAVGREPERRQRSLGWILPLAILAGLLGLIWWGVSRSSVRAGREDRGLAEQTAREQATVGRTASLDALKTKYQSVLDVAKAQGVRISNITAENGKLRLQGTAPSMDAINKVRDEIGKINPKMDDIVMDLKVDSSLAPKTSENMETNAPVASNEQAAAESAGREKMRGDSETALPRTKPETPSAPESTTVSGSSTYVVKAGDTLGTISKQFYGNSNGTMRIFTANKTVLKNPNTLRVGQKLEIPAE